LLGFARIVLKNFSLGFYLRETVAVLVKATGPAGFTGIATDGVDGKC